MSKKLTDEEAKIYKSRKAIRTKCPHLIASMFQGEWRVIDGNFTAYTDGLNVYYSAQYLRTLTEPNINGLVLHEEMHKVKFDVRRFRDLFEIHSTLTNVACDIVINNGIIDMNFDETFLKLPEGAIFDAQYKGKSPRQIFYILLKDNPDLPKPDKFNFEKGSNDGSSKKIKIFVNGTEREVQTDHHDHKALDTMSKEKIYKIEKEMKKVLIQSDIAAKVRGGGEGGIPLEIKTNLYEERDWLSVLSEFSQSCIVGRSEYSRTRFNLVQMSYGVYSPALEGEQNGDLLLCFDTSGSMMNLVNEKAQEIQTIIEQTKPSSIRVLWWDTQVYPEQIFRDDYDNIIQRLKPQGGGGTTASCVSKYINDNKIKADCVVVFTDGYLENNIKWDIQIPTMWFVTENKSFEPPRGKKVFIN